MSFVPSWYKQRQGKIELVGERLCKLTGPNLPETFLGLRRADNGKWQGFLRQSADGSDSAATDPKFDREYDAWEVAFEMYRDHVII